MTGLVININLRQIGLQVWLKWRSVIGSKPIYIGVLISTWHPKWSIRQSQILKKHPKFYQSAVFWSKFVRNVLFHANQEIKIQIEEKSNGNIHCHSLNDVGINLIRMCMFLSDFVTNIHLVGIYSGLLSVPCISSLESAIQMEEIVCRVHNWHIDQKINNFEVGNVGIKKKGDKELMNNTLHCDFVWEITKSLPLKSNGTGSIQGKTQGPFGGVWKSKQPKLTSSWKHEK